MIDNLGDISNLENRGKTVSIDRGVRAGLKYLGYRSNTPHTHQDQGNNHETGAVGQC